MTAGLILAGGASTRMGRPKALLEVFPGGPTFVAHLVGLFSDAGLGPVVVVTGAHRFEVPAPAHEAHAPDWALGMRASLRAGLRELPDGGLLLTHVDRPVVALSTLRALLRGPADESRVPWYEGHPGHPVYLPASLRTRLLAPDATPLDQLLVGARAVPVGDPDVLLNINTPEDLARLHEREA